MIEDIKFSYDVGAADTAFTPDVPERQLSPDLQEHLTCTVNLGPGSTYPPPDRSAVFTMEDEGILPPPKIEDLLGKETVVKDDTDRPRDIYERSAKSNATPQSPAPGLQTGGIGGSGVVPPERSVPGDSDMGDNEGKDSDEDTAAIGDAAAQWDNESKPSHLDVTEARPQIEFGTHETLDATVHQFGERIAEVTVVIGDTALQAALGDDFATENTAMSVPEGAYSDLREKLRDVEGWEEKRLPGDRMILTNSQVEIANGWPLPGQTHEELESRGWRTDSGLVVANPSDLAAHYTEVWSQHSIEALAAMRAHMQDPTKPRLPDEVFKHEAELVRDCFPPELRDHPDVQSWINFGAEGQLLAHLYGDPRIGREGSINRIEGELEKRKYMVPAIYHNGHGVAESMRRLNQHYDNVNATARRNGYKGDLVTPKARAISVTTNPWMDDKYGGGREKDNKEGYDEKRSAELAQARALQHGHSPQDAALSYGLTFASGFTEPTEHEGPKQKGADGTLLEQSNCGVDLDEASRPGNVVDGIKICTENGYSARASKFRWLGKFMIEIGAEDLRHPREILQVVDMVPDGRPSGTSKEFTVHRYVTTTWRMNANNFIRPGGYTYPRRWTLGDNIMRAQGADKLVELSRAKPGELVAAYDKAVEFRDGGWERERPAWLRRRGL